MNDYEFFFINCIMLFSLNFGGLQCYSLKYLAMVDIVYNMFEETPQSRKKILFVSLII